MTPSVLGGVVYIPSEHGTLYAIDAETGEELWTFAKPLSDFATPSYEGGLLFAGSLDGNLYAIDPATGEEAWHFTTGGPLSRCTAAKDGVVYTGSEDGFLYAIDAATGTELWKYDTGRILSAPRPSPMVWSMWPGPAERSSRSMRPPEPKRSPLTPQPGKDFPGIGNQQHDLLG